MTLESSHNCSISVSSPPDHEYPSQSVLTAINAINLILGVPIHSYVLWLILSGACGTLASEFFSLNLTVSEIIFSLASIIYFAWIYTCSDLCHTLFFFFAGFVYFAVPSFQCCICVERYIAVVHPVVFVRYKPLRYKVACSCAVWPIVLAFCIGYSPIAGRQNSLHYYALVCLYIVLISVMSFCCVMVLKALKQPGPGEGQRDSREGRDVKSRAFQIILVILIAMLVSYLPHCITLPLKGYFSVNHYNFVLSIAYLMTIMPKFVHPFLYIKRVGKCKCFNAVLCLVSTRHVNGA